MATERSQRDERWWPWWWQTRDAVATIVGVGLVTVESYRGTYNPVAMGFAAVCFGVLASSFLGRWLIGRSPNGNGNGGTKR